MGDGRDCVEGRSPDSTRPLWEGDSRRAGTLLPVPLRHSGLTGSESVGTQREAQVEGQGPGMEAELAGARRPGVGPLFSPSQGGRMRAQGRRVVPIPRSGRQWALDCGGARAPLLCVRAPLPRPLPLGCCSCHPTWGLCTAIWSVRRKTQMPWGPEDPEDCSLAEISTPGPDVQDRACSPTHPRLSFPPCVYWRDGGPPCWPQML